MISVCRLSQFGRFSLPYKEMPPTRHRKPACSGEAGGADFEGSFGRYTIVIPDETEARSGIQ